MEILCLEESMSDEVDREESEIVTNDGGARLIQA